MIHRSGRPATFTIIDNSILNDARLDWKEMAILIYLLSKPDHWEISPSHLSSIRKLSRDGVYSALKKLCDIGYAARKPNPKGGWDWHIYDYPNTENPNTENPNTENPNRDFKTQVNTEYKQELKKKVSTDTHTSTAKPKKPANEKNARVCDEKKSSLPVLSAEQQACMEWAMLQPFWARLINNDPNKFLTRYSSLSERGLRVQFEEYLQAKKNRDAATNNNHGSTNNLGANYDTQQHYQQSRKLSLAERAAAATQRCIDREEREARERGQGWGFDEEWRVIN